MSCMYYRVEKVPPPAETYGFKKVSRKEAVDIAGRLSKPTYSSKVYSEGPWQLHNYEGVRTNFRGRQTPTTCKRGQTPPSNVFHHPRRHYTDREFLRMIRRLQRSTISSNKMTTDSEETQCKKHEEPPVRRAKSANSDPAHVTAKLQRPTTATLAKDINTCHLCYEHEKRAGNEEWDPFNYDYSDSKTIPPEEVEFVVDRISAPTTASERGVRRCRKTPVTIDPYLEASIREQLPLISGLDKSKNVNEVVKRLYPRRKQTCVPEATKITVAQ